MIEGEEEDVFLASKGEAHINSVSWQTDHRCVLWILFKMIVK